MRYFFCKQIHSCFSGLSSSDVFVVKEVSEQAFNRIAKGKETIISEIYGFSLAYLDADEFYYNKERESATRPSKEEFDEYVAQFCLAYGFDHDSEFLSDNLSKHWADKDAERFRRRKAAGYVIPEWSKELTPEAYQGGFSDDIFHRPELYNYLKAGGCYGFIGHPVRKPRVDEVMESEFLKINDDKSLLSMWLTSTGGRHFGDSLEGKTFNEQREYIQNNMQDVVDQALRYRENE